MRHEHEIFVSGGKVCCTCGFNKQFRDYKCARASAEKHARATNQTYIIRPLAST